MRVSEKQHYDQHRAEDIVRVCVPLIYSTLNLHTRLGFGRKGYGHLQGGKRVPRENIEMMASHVRHRVTLTCMFLPQSETVCRLASSSSSSLDIHPSQWSEPLCECILNILSHPGLYYLSNTARVSVSGT